MKTSWSEQDARRLSGKLYPLADQWREVCEELDQAGLATAAKVKREAYRELAGGTVAFGQLERYWTEYAKERLAGLRGPIDILKGDLPATTAYRSAFLDRLRADAAAGKLKSETPIVSPQIEPTIKRGVEMMMDDPRVQTLHAALTRERALAASRLGDAPRDEAIHDEDRYEFLMRRYAGSLEPAGFKLDSHRRQGLVFRKRISSGEFDFLFVDASKRDVGFGLLETVFALTVPRKAVLPSAVPLSAVATIPSDCLVPEFRSACIFAPRSIVELCLAADANCLLAKSLFNRVDALLAVAD